MELACEQIAASTYFYDDAHTAGQWCEEFMRQAKAENGNHTYEMQQFDSDGQFDS